jgi:hypothetical protein
MAEFSTNNPRPLRRTFYPEGAISKTIRVSAEVVFGSPSKNCDGYGVCMLTSTGLLSSLSLRCPVTACELEISMDHLQMKLEIGKHVVADSVANRYFRKSCFWLEEDYKFSRMMSEKWGRTGRFKISAGEYSITSTDDKWIIYFQLQVIKSL